MVVNQSDIRTSVIAELLDLKQVVVNSQILLGKRGVRIVLAREASETRRSREGKRVKRQNVRHDAGSSARQGSKDKT